MAIPAAATPLNLSIRQLVSLLITPRGSKSTALLEVTGLPPYAGWSDEPPALETICGRVTMIRNATGQRFVIVQPARVLGTLPLASFLSLDADQWTEESIGRLVPNQLDSTNQCRAPLAELVRQLFMRPNARPLRPRPKPVPGITAYETPRVIDNEFVAVVVARHVLGEATRCPCCKEQELIVTLARVPVPNSAEVHCPACQMARYSEFSLPTAAREVIAEQ